MGGGVAVHGQMALSSTVAMKVLVSFRQENTATKSVLNFLSVPSVASKVTWIESSVNVK